MLAIGAHNDDNDDDSEEEDEESDESVEGDNGSEESDSEAIKVLDKGDVIPRDKDDMLGPGERCAGDRRDYGPKPVLLLSTQVV